MDRWVLFYILLLIWLVPFTFSTEKIRDNVLDTCLDGVYHKTKPGPESSLYSQCTPWKYRSCCTDETSKKVHELGHHNFNYDHCSATKRLSAECRKYFIRDTCFYECSPNVGPWLVKVDMKIRKERFHKVPLCMSDCKAWYDACKYDYTCNTNWIRGWNWTKSGNQCAEGSVCDTFENMFRSATNFCEKVWDEAWKVTPDTQPCMKLWFDGENGNPNDKVAEYYLQQRLSNLAVLSIPKYSAYIVIATFSIFKILI